LSMSKNVAEFEAHRRQTNLVRGGMVTHPASTRHQRPNEQERGQLGIKDSLVRFSIGLEDTKNDVFQALKV